MTPVEFVFYDPDGDPVANKEFEIRLPKAGFVPRKTGVVVPETLTATTGPDGRVVVDLAPSSSPYFVYLIRDPETEDCCEAERVAYRMYVPDSPEMVRAQDLFFDPMPSALPYDEQAILAISEAKAVAVAAADRAHDSAELAQAAIGESGANAASALASAGVATSKANDAAVSATASQDSATLASTKAEESRVLSVNSGNSANASASSASAALISENDAATSAAASLASKNAAAASAATATQQATAATTAAGTATTKAGDAVASATAAANSASQSYQDANRSKTEADKAAVSATNAKTSETNSKTSETNAATSATNASTAGSTAGTAAANAVVANKQDKHVNLTTISGVASVANLTAFSGLTGTADRLPYFTGAGALALGTLTAKARLLMSCTDTAGMRSELALVPITSATDVTGGRLATIGWMGIGVPIQMQPTDSADNLPTIAARFIFGNGGIGLPYNFVYIDQLAFGAGSWIRQIAYAFNSTNMWVRFFVAGSAAGSVWTPVVIGEKVTSFTDTTSGRLLTTGYCGLGSKDNNPYLGNNLNPTDYRTGGSFFGQWNMEGLGLVIGILTVYAASDAQWLGQSILNLASGALFTRSQVGHAEGGVFIAWCRNYNDFNSFNDPQTGGGLMSRTVVNNLAISKFANGVQIINGIFLAATASVAANAYTPIDITIPVVTGLDTSFTSVSMQAAASASSDHYGIISGNMSSTTVCRIVIRNGATAQPFVIRGTIVGHWK